MAFLCWGDGKPITFGFLLVRFDCYYSAGLFLHVIHILLVANCEHWSSDFFFVLAHDNIECCTVTFV